MIRARAACRIGGYRLLIVRPEDRARLSAAMAPLLELDFRLDSHGSPLVFVDDN